MTSDAYSQRNRLASGLGSALGDWQSAHLSADRLTKLFEPMAYQGASQALIDRLLASLDDK